MSRFSKLFLFCGIVGLTFLSVMSDEAADDAVYDAAQVVYDDDKYEDMEGKSLDDVMIMPLSCIKYNDEHMIKFQMFQEQRDEDGKEVCLVENEDDILGTFVVPVSNYMRAYFNYKVLEKGDDFTMPRNAGHLECAMLETSAYSEQPLYAKIGCMEKETYTNTRFRLHLYTDKGCTQVFDDGMTDSIRGIKGYIINGSYFNPHVGFRPPFYSCSSCKPEEISYYFSKEGSYWLDDDAVANGERSHMYFDDWTDDYEIMDDNMKVVSQYVNNARVYSKDDDDDFYSTDDSRRFLSIDKTYAQDLYKEVNIIRMLEENEQEDDKESVEEWNMCTQIMKYGSWCDAECRALDMFAINEWSQADVILLAAISSIMTLLMVIVYKKKAHEYIVASKSTDMNASYTGVPPVLLLSIFLTIVTGITYFAFLNLVNETLLIGIIMCVFLFIYTARLTLNDSKRKPLLSGEGMA